MQATRIDRCAGRAKAEDVSAVITPGLLPGLAPPAPETSPPSTASDARSPDTGKTFADTVAERRAQQDAADAATERPEATTPPAPQAASEPNAPPGAPTADTTSTEPGGLLALVRDLLAQGGATEDTTQTDVPLLDRPAGAGDTETELVDVNAMEALMAQTLLMRTPVVEADVTIAPIALAAPSVDAAGSGALSTMVGLQQAISDLAAAGEAVEAAPGDIAPVAAPIADGVEGQSAPQALGPIAVTPSVETPAAASTIADGPGQAAQVAPAVSTPPDLPVEIAPQAVTPAQPAPAAAVPTSTAVADDEATALPVTAVTDGPSSMPEIEPEPRRTRVEATASNAVPQTAPGVQGDTLARVDGAVRTEVATGGAVTSQIANTVQTAVMRGEHEVRLVLNPPELGRVEIRIVESSGGIRVHMLADQPGARDLIERQLPMLQQALAARDVRVERMEVERSGESASAQQWSNSQGSNDGQRQGGQRDAGQWASPDWSPLAAMGLGLTESARTARPVAAAAGGLDVMA